MCSRLRVDSIPFKTGSCSFLMRLTASSARHGVFFISNAGGEPYLGEEELRSLLEPFGIPMAVTMLGRSGRKSGAEPVEESVGFSAAAVLMPSEHLKVEVVEKCRSGRLAWEGRKLSAYGAMRVGAATLELLVKACRTPFRHTGHIVMAASYAEGGVSADGREVLLHTLESTGRGGFSDGRKSGLQCFRRRFLWSPDIGEWVWKKSIDEPAAPGWGVVRVGRLRDEC